MTEIYDLRPWLTSVTSDSIPVVAARLGVTHGNLYKQLKGEAPIPPITVVRIARSYDQNPIPGLVACGLLDSKEVEEISDVRKATDRILVHEIEYRLGLRESR